MKANIDDRLVYIRIFDTQTRLKKGSIYNSNFLSNDHVKILPASENFHKGDFFYFSSQKCNFEILALDQGEVEL